MPELPEVETVKAGIAPAMEGQKITKAQINRPDLRWPFPDNFAQRLEGQEVLRLRRRSKYILGDLSSGETLLIHLGMSGRMVVSGHKIGDFFHDHPPAAKHDHVVLDMENGARITFNDPRRFGAMDLFPTGDERGQLLLSKLGPEPLGNGFNAAYLAQKLAGKRSPIKSALLDQRLVAGLGNIYVCEALFRTRIAPTRLAGAVTGAECDVLVPAIRDILSEAIAAGGSSLRDHRQASGELGYFQHNFAVYGREDAPCITCQTPIARLTQSGRSSFYCPSCQD